MLKLQTIFNGESGLSVRAKINSMFQDLIDGNEGANELWKRIINMTSSIEMTQQELEDTYVTIKAQILNAYDYTDKQVTDLKTYVDALESGIGGFIPSTSYNPNAEQDKAYTFIAVGAGTYTYFTNQSGSPITITDDNALTIFYKGAGSTYWQTKSVTSILIKEALDGGNAATMGTSIQIRRDSVANWNSSNPILKQGEIALVALNSSTPYRYDDLKIGDGVSTFLELPYVIKDSINTGISWSEIDDFPANATEAYNFSAKGKPTRLTVYEDITNRNVGVLDIIYDEEQKQLTEIFTTHYRNLVLADVTPLSDPYNFYVFYRSWVRTSDNTNSDYPYGMWSDWKLAYDSKLTEKLTLVNAGIYINLSISPKYSEYRTPTAVAISASLRTDAPIRLDNTLVRSIKVQVKNSDVLDTDYETAINTSYTTGSDEEEYQLFVNVDYDYNGIKIAKEDYIMLKNPRYHGFGKSYTDVMVAANKLSPAASANGRYPKLTCPSSQMRYYIIIPLDEGGYPEPSQFTMGGAPYVMNKTIVNVGHVRYAIFESGSVYNSGAEVEVTVS